MKEDARPNILMILTDQQRYDSLGCYGAKFMPTPNIDGLGNDGAVFERCYVNNPLCTPSRASLWTGKHLPGHGVYRLYDNLPRDERLFSSQLQQEGYTTALFGKLHVSSHNVEHASIHPGAGFDRYELCNDPRLEMEAPMQAYARWLESRHPEFYEKLRERKGRLRNHPEHVHLTHWAAERTIDFIETQDSPFFACMSLFDPHGPYTDFPGEVRKLLPPESIPEPRRDKQYFDNRPSDMKRECHRTDKFGVEVEETLREFRYGYFASIAFLDQEVGRVLKALEDKGLRDNTLVIFASDHGDMLGDYGFLTKGAMFNDACTRVPLLMRWPERIAGGNRPAGVVQLHDLAATVLDAAGVAPETVQTLMPDAASLLALANGDTDAVREFAICAYRNSGRNAENPSLPYWDPAINATMICDERYKLSLYDVGKERPEGELVDLLEDPDERVNRYDDPALSAVRLKLTEQLYLWENRQERHTQSRGGSSVARRRFAGWIDPVSSIRRW